MCSTINTNTDKHYHCPNLIEILGNKKLEDHHYKIIENQNYTNLKSEYYNLDFKKIPKCIKSLNCKGICNDDIPDHLIELITDYQNINLKNLPQTLVMLDIFIPTFDYDDTEFDYLPVKLESLIIRGLYNGYLDNLPVNLKTLKIYTSDFNRTLNNLPSGLEVLELQNNIYNHVLSNLPLSLKSLSIKLIINYTTKCEIINFPNQLIELSLALVRIDDIPESVEIVDISYYHVADLKNYIFPRIPKTLKKMIIDRGIRCDEVK
jgi:hypothetical protein